ncbi:MAG TPA: methyl-accepting chemotaxis protein [Gallionella sp.]|nr:methyl-accepting chemotaxis protein [Gallionella sp.]
MNFNNLNIASRLALGFGVLLVFMLVITGMGIGGLSKLNEKLHAITDVNNAEIQTASDMRSSVSSIAIALRNLVLMTKDAEKQAEMESIKQEIQKYKDAKDLLAEMFKLPGTTEVETALLAKIQEDEAAVFPLIEKATGLAMANKSAEVLMVLMEEVKPKQGKWLDEVTEVMVTKQRINDEAAAEAVKTYTWARNVVLACSAVALILGFAAAFMIARSITKPIKQAVEVAEHIAGGDLTRQIEVKTSDEVGKLMRALKEMNDSLRSVIVHARENSDRVTAAAAELSSSAGQVSASSQHQSEAASSMAAAVEEMTVSINQIADHADDAHKTSVESSTLAHKGGEVIHDTVSDMNLIAESVNESSRLVQALSQQSEQISEVVKMIKEVAEQTNLLALNAAIEAARAGEQGRGFAVVADEVRKLAERTAKSTLEISSMIEKTHGGIHGALHSLQTGVERVNAGVAKASQAGDAVTQINSGAQMLVGTVNDISAAIKEQSEASNEISRHVEKIAQMAEENHAAVDETAKTAHQLEKLATDLHETVGRFKV